jgi:Phosphate-selective porin O and P
VVSGRFLEHLQTAINIDNDFQYLKSGALLKTAPLPKNTGTHVKNFLLSNLLILFSAFSMAAHADPASSEIEALKQQLQEQAGRLARLETKPSAPAEAADTSIGGYGEIIYNRYTKDTSQSQADLRRFVLFFGHRFNDNWTFNSEVEWEHAVASKNDNGEVEIEQAYLNYQFSQALQLKAGLILMPFGILNLSHEPPVFYGVERNEVETRIIPSTWREGGVGLWGTTVSGLTWDVGVTTGFDLAKLDDASSPLAASHQELQNAKAHDVSFYGALGYKGASGLSAGLACFTGNSLQHNSDFRANPDPTSAPSFEGLAGRVTLTEAHARWQKNGFDLETLFSQGWIGDSAGMDKNITAFNTANGKSRPLVPESFYGWLVQAAYSIPVGREATLSPYAREEQYNTQAKMPAGFNSDPANRDFVTTFGVSYRPITQLAFKADYQAYRHNTGTNRFNLGMGYMF